MKKILKSLSKKALGALGFALVRKRTMERQTEERTRALVYAISSAEGFELPPNAHRMTLLSRLMGTPVPEALHLLHYLHESLKFPGDVCEFGVAQGTTSTLLANELLSSEKTLWLYDSFEGLPEPSEEDVLIDDIMGLGDMAAYAGKMSNPESEVIGRLECLPEPFSRFEIVKGFFENSPETPGPDRVCWAYVDFDFYRPILDVLRYLHPRLSNGGAVVVDDFGFFSAGAEKAVREFLQDHADDYELIIPNEAYGHFCILRKRL